jgi:hypothetical protein
MRIERVSLPDEPEYIKTMQLLRQRYGAVCKAAFFRARRADVATQV